MSDTHPASLLFLQQPIHKAFILGNCRRMVKAGASKEWVASIEPFILQLTAAELLAEHVPRQFEELHARPCIEVFTLQVFLQVGSDLGIVEIPLRRCQDQTAATQLPYDLCRLPVRLRDENPQSGSQGTERSTLAVARHHILG